MANANFINLKGTRYDFEDTQARADISDLKSALSVMLPETTGTRTFTQGAISSTNGTNTTSNTRIRLYNFLHAPRIDVTIPSGFKAYTFEYSAATIGSFVRSNGWLPSGTITLAGGKYYRIVVAYDDDRVITPDAGANIIFTYATPDTTLTVAGAAADSKAVGDLLLPAMLYRGPLSGEGNIVDLDDVANAGMYGMPTNMTYLNAPDLEDHAAQLYVFGSPSARLQICTSRYMYGKIYYRHYASSYGTAPWGPWRTLPMQADTYTSADDLDDFSESGVAFYSGSSVPANAPIPDVGGIVFGIKYNSTYRGQIYINGRNDFYIRTRVSTGWTKWKNLSRPNDMLDFTVVKGTWMNDGVLKRSGVLCICPDHKFTLTPGSALEFYLEPGWVYSIREGKSDDNYTMTAHLSREKTHIVQFPYVTMYFNKFVDGEPVNLTVNDFDDSVIIHTSGDAIGSKNVSEHHDFPETAGQLNVIYRAYQMSMISYTALEKLYLHSGGSIPSTLVVRDVDAGTELDGIPYSSMRETMASVPQATSLQAFMTMILNPNSYIYTKHYEGVAPGYDYNSRCYVGAVCSTLVAYCYGIDDVIPTTISFADYPGLNPLPENQQNPQSLKLADMLNHAGDHIVIVTDIIRTERGKVKYIEVTEAWKPLCRSVQYTPEQIVLRYFDSGYVAYRYQYIDDVTYEPSPWVHIDDTETETPEYNPVLSPRKGEESNWAVGETVEIDVLDNTAGYTHYVVKDVSSGSVIATVAIPYGDVISLEALSEGRYSVHLTDGSNVSNPVRFDIIDAEAEYTPLGSHKVKVEFESASSRTPSAIYWCCNKQNNSDYKAVRAYHILSAEEIAAGEAVIDEPVEHRDTDTVNGVWLMRMAFKTEYGLFASPLEAVSVT